MPKVRSASPRWAEDNLSLPTVSRTDLVDRIAALPHMGGVPLEELEWLVEHGSFEVQEAGYVVGPKGVPIERLLLIISGHVAIRVDRGAGPKTVAEWHAGDVTGLLPYSRMKAPPGDSRCVEKTEALAIRQERFREMVHNCPVFTAFAVHTMIDRARQFNTSDLQDEKMVSLGKLAAGLAHELNNPASAAKRGANLLLQDLSRLDAATRALGTHRLNDELLNAIEQVRPLFVARPDGSGLSPIRQAAREDEIADWMVRHHADPAHAPALADTLVTIDALDTLASATSGDTLDATIRWLAARCATQALAADIAQAVTRIHELVAAVKAFTYMDNLAAQESVEVESGIRDTMRVLESKAIARNASITLDVDGDLPHVRAAGAELNQVWFNLIDNALDAIAESGRIDINARSELDRVLVRVVDNGPGIPPHELPRVFDSFFTTKPPGKGTGLGLDLTQRLVRRYHGDISVESRPGMTEFRVSLPAEKPAPAGHEGVPGRAAEAG
jgi:signal transduction histidine kinase